MRSSIPRLLVLCATCCTLALAADKKAPALTTPSSTSGLVLHKWSGDLNVPDPVAVTVTPDGVVYASNTTRRKVADLDIREHMQWVADDVALEDIDQKMAFLHEALAPGKMRHPEGDLADHNKDGSIDWKDLTVHTERLWRLEDTKGAGVADKRTLFAEGFNTEVTGIAAGILWHDGWVYATIAPDLWRLRDTNGDGVADEREIVVHGFGHHIAYAGHDMHGLCIGPDGRIYWTIGDKGVNVHTKDGLHVAEPHQGCILRCEPDGSGFEIYAHGLRNLQEIAFDEYGNIFGVDNDSDRPGERERVVNVVERSDSGWRCYYQYMKGWNPWMDEGIWKVRHDTQPAFITPPLANAHDGPAGFAYNPGTALSAAWKHCFFVNQFPKGEMAAIRFAPIGATFKVTEDKVVTRGVMGIGMAWSPDGKLFMADWDGGYPLDGKGAVWSVDDPTGTGSTERKETEEILRGGFEKREVKELSKLLGHDDMRVRRGAQFELVKRATFDALKKVALDPKQPQLARIHALWGLGQGLRSGALGLEDARGLFEKLKADKDAELRAQLAKILGDAPSCAPLGESLIPLLSDVSIRVRFLTAITLGKLKTPQATTALLKLAAANNDVDAYLRHAAVTGLEGCATTEQLAGQKKNPSRAVRLASALALRRQGSPSLAAFLSDADSAIATEAARGIHDDIPITDAIPALAAMLDRSAALPDPLLRRALNAAFRMGNAANAERVMKFALREDAAPELRALALELVAEWAEPPRLDHVIGRAQKIAPRKPTIIAKAIQPRLEALMALKDAKLKALGIQLLTRYELPVAPSLAAAAVMAPEAPAEVRVAALRLLAKQHPHSDELAETLNALFADPKTHEALRVAALDAELVRDKAKAVTQCAALLEKGTTAEKQHVMAVLAEAALPEADQILVKQLDALMEKSLAPALQLDVLEAAQARSESAPALKEKLSAFEASRAPAAGTPAAFAECLEGGDAKLGKQAVQENLAANCIACHRFDKREGSNVGPPLDKIGQQRDRAYLLEALITPQAKIAPGYGVITVTLKNKEVISAALVAGDDRQLQVRLPDGKLRSIPMTNVASKTVPISVMPPMGLILTKRQVRDVVSYLSSLKGSEKTKKKK